MTTMRNRICFVALNCYNLISGRDDVSHIGGAEVQQWLMARWMVAQGYEVSFVTYDHGQPDVEQINGVTVYKAFCKNDGLPVIRFFYPRLLNLFSAMKEADADIYYQRGAGQETGIIANWCQRNNKKLIFASANDADCSKDLSLLIGWRDKAIFRYGLSRADAVITQTSTQAELLRKNYNLSPLLLRNCGEELPIAEAVDNGNKPRSILWIGRFSQEKRLEVMLEVIERCPEYHFHIVGSSNSNSAYADNLWARAEKLNNIQLHGRIPHEDISRLYQRCSILCSTSVVEGFPNVYIEAWSMGVPVLATFDPDGIISEHNVGWVRDSVTGFVQVLQAVKDDFSECERKSKSARAYFEVAHKPEANMPTFRRLIDSF